MLPVQPDPLPRDLLLLQMLGDLRTAIDSNTDRVEQVESRITEAVQPLVKRMDKLEVDNVLFQRDVKDSARKWGAVGGIGTACTAVVMSIVAFFTSDRFK